MIGMGFVKTWDQMAALRVILGIFEAGYFPSCIYLLSTWYTRCEYLQLIRSGADIEPDLDPNPKNCADYADRLL